MKRFNLLDGIVTIYKIVFDKRFLKDLEKIPQKFRDKIREKVANLASNPRPEGYTKLKSSDKFALYRIRCGDYRVVYTIQDHILIVVVVELGHRKEIYREV